MNRSIVRYSSAVACLSIATLALTACSGAGSSSKATSANHTLTIAIDTDFQTFNPGLSSYQESNELIYNVYDEFYHLGTTAGPSPYITNYDADKCDSMAIASSAFSPNDMSVTINVRKGMTFHHTGNPVNAADITWLFNHAAAGHGTGAPDTYGAMQFLHFESWHQTGPYSVQIKFSQPVSQDVFCQYLRQVEFAVLDATQIKKHITNSDPFGDTYIDETPDLGSGAYEVESYTPGSQMVLQAYPEYWGLKPYYNRIVIEIVPDEATRALLLREGSVDVAEYLGQDTMASLKAVSTVRILSIPSRNQMWMGFHFVGALRNRLVRQALAYAVPYSAIISQVYKGYAKLSTGVIADLGKDNDPSTYPYTYNPAKAKGLLRQAGFSNGIRLTCAYQQGISTEEQLLVLLQGAFKNVGVSLSLQPETGAALATALGTPTTACWLREVLWYIDDPGYVGYYVGSSGSPLASWFGNFSSPSLDKVIADMQLPTTTPQQEAAQKAAAIQYQRIVNGLAPILFLGDLDFQIGTQTTVCGYQQQPDSLLYYAAFRAC
jgi:peptide/nickel transport system substrate-binding protein